MRNRKRKNIRILHQF